MSTENTLRAAYNIFSDGYNNPATLGVGFYLAFGDEDAGEFGEVEHCVMEFDVAPVTVDTSQPVTLSFSGNIATGTKHVRRWTAAWPTNYSLFTNPLSFTTTNQVAFTDNGSNTTVDLDVAAIVADCETNSKLTIILGFPENAPNDVSYVDYASGDQPTLNYVWIGDDFESYAENREVSTIAGWTTDSADVIIGTHNSSKRAGLLSASQLGYMERTMDASGTLSYDYRANASSDYVRVWVNGVNVKTHTASSGSDSVTVFTGQVVRFAFETNAGPAYVDNLSLAIAAETKTFEATITLDIDAQGRHTTVGTAPSLDVADITLDSLGSSYPVNAGLLVLDPITLEASSRTISRGTFQPTITLELESDGQVVIQGTGVTDPIIVGIYASNIPVEGTLNVTLDDILVSGEIPQGGRPAVGTLNPASSVITLFLQGQAVKQRIGELTVSPIIITLYARSQGPPALSADSPFLDPLELVIIGDKNATFRDRP
jgi:hypothetical protein